MKKDSMAELKTSIIPEWLSNLPKSEQGMYIKTMATIRKIRGQLPKE